MARHAPSDIACNLQDRNRRHLTPRLFHDRRRRYVGLIGGSFNPAHDGHLHMSSLAHTGLQLDEIWWLVTPQNPLKSSENIAPLDQRLAHARKITASHSFIRVITPERGRRENYTFNTLKHIQKMAPYMCFVWIMGADNLVQFPAWKRYKDIARRIPIAVIDRPSYSYQAISTGRHVLSHRLPARRLGKRGRRGRAIPPLWCFITGRRHPASATALRASGFGE
ncbi:MAG: nicotinate-nucleotide adenylyltransferase [Alphaproteobacteria bacterium]